jgi:predicted dehydrogenase
MLKVAVIGIGEQSWDNILPSLAQIPTITTVATCDIDKNKADLAAMKYGAKSYCDYKLMFDNEELDAIIVASYPDVHYEVAKLALAKGIAIFIEKPPTFTLKELEHLISINRYNVTTGVGLNFNYAEAVNIVDELSRKSDFGKIKYLSISHYGNKPKEPLWGLKSTVRSFLLAQAIHPIGFMTKYGETIKTYDIKTINHGGDLFVSGNFLLENSKGDQIIANLTTGNMSPHFMWRVELITDRSIVVRINSLWELEIFDSHKTTNIIDQPKRWKDVWNPSPLSNGYSRTGYLHQFTEFFNCIKSKKKFASSLENLIPVYQILNVLEKELIIEHENIREQIRQY